MGIIQRIKRLTGSRHFSDYRDKRLLGYALMMTALTDGARDMKGKQIVYRAVMNRYLARLRKRYRPVIDAYMREHRGEVLEHASSNKVWVCWLQGMDEAPELIQLCYASIRKHIPEDRELVLINESNYTDYITLPEDILALYEKGEIGKAFFADLIRLELLIRYGGTWIDTSVYFSDGDIPRAFFDAELFMPQFGEPKVFDLLRTGFDDRCTQISNWFMTAKSNDEVLMLIQHLLYTSYKSKRDGEYFIFHNFAQLALETYPDKWHEMPFYCAHNAFCFQERMFDPFDEAQWEIIRRQSPMHKLNYKRLIGREAEPGSYYDRLRKGELDPA